MAGAGLGISLAVAIFLAPLASESPDGLEYVGGQKAGFLPPDGPSALPAAPIAGYRMPGLSGYNPALATAASGLVGTLVVFGVGISLARSVASGGPEGIGADAA